MIAFDEFVDHLQYLHITNQPTPTKLDPIHVEPLLSSESIPALGLAPRPVELPRFEFEIEIEPPNSEVQHCRLVSPGLAPKPLPPSTSKLKHESSLGHVDRDIDIEPTQPKFEIERVSKFGQPNVTPPVLAPEPVSASPPKYVSKSGLTLRPKPTRKILVKLPTELNGKLKSKST